MIIGLTGSIASGKSTVASMIKQLAIPIVDADLIAREVVQANSPTLREIADAFGDEILTETGELNRPRLGEIIFNDEEKRKLLNSIIHPAIRKQMLSERDHYVAQGQHVVMDIPLLFESNLMHYVEKVLVVTVSEAVQLQRLMARNQFTVEEARARISSQMPLSEKVKAADAVIENDGLIEETAQQLHEILHDWKVL